MSDDPARSALGVAQLIALGDSSLLDEDQQLFVDAALAAVVEDAAEEVEAAGSEVEVVRALETDALEPTLPEALESTPVKDVEGSTDA